MYERRENSKKKSRCVCVRDEETHKKLPVNFSEIPINLSERRGNSQKNFRCVCVRGEATHNKSPVCIYERRASSQKTLDKFEWDAWVLTEKTPDVYAWEPREFKKNFQVNLSEKRENSQKYVD